MDSEYNKTFTKCPHCGSEERFFEELGKEAVANGTVGPDFHLAYIATNGVVQDKQKSLYPGDKPVGFAFETDICTGCGAIYATKVKRAEVEVRMTPAGLVKPNFYTPGNDGMNRMQRRHPTLN